MCAERSSAANQVVSFGCRLNAYEAEVMRGHLSDAGMENAIVINSCAVTSEAERQVRQSIRKLRKENPTAKIVVTGCAAQVHPDDFAAMDEVDHVIDNEAKMHSSTFAALADGSLSEKVRVNDIMSVTETALHMVEGFETQSRAFVQIQNGCNHRCTFCIIPFGRGNSRSVAMGEVVSQIRMLVERGYQEVVLTGVDISDYGKDLPGTPTLGQLCRRLLQQVPELARLRLSSIDSIEVDEDIFRLLAEEPRFMPHMHLSLQAGDNMILKRMKRRHLREDAIAFCERARQARPDVVFGADIITGFPTETEEMFQQTLDIVDACGLTWLHVFPYSEREGTPAAKMPQVEKTVRKERAGRLRAKGQEKVQALLAAEIGKERAVLVEKNGNGRTEHFIPVQFVGECVPEAGQIVKADMTGEDGSQLLARVKAA